MNTKEQFVANDLGTIIANQAIVIANLKQQNQQLQEQLDQKDQVNTELKTQLKTLRTRNNKPKSNA